MKAYNIAFILIVTLFNGVRYTEQTNMVYNWQVIKYDNGTVIVVDESETVADSESSLEELEENVKFWLYTNENTTGCEIPLGDEESLTACGFDTSRPTRIVIHGWNSLKNATMCVNIRDAFLETGYYNVIIVDWDTWACQDYISARMRIVAIGQFLSIKMMELVDQGMRVADLMVVGHSLGAHIAGVACRNTTFTVPIVIALDPAGPLFYGTTMNARLSSTDATCVEVIHTSAGKLGYSGSLGDIDHWPNGGSSQPGCGWDIIGTCAHARAYDYYEEIVATDNFTSYACDSYDTYESGNCSDGTSTYMGRGCEMGATTGNYYLVTNETSPYSEG